MDDDDDDDDDISIPILRFLHADDIDWEDRIVPVGEVWNNDDEWKLVVVVVVVVALAQALL
jgi:hypothetical protein